MLFKLSQSWSDEWRSQWSVLCINKSVCCAMHQNLAWQCWSIRSCYTYAWMSNSCNIAWYSDSTLRAAWFGESVTFSIVGGFLTTRYASSPTFKIAPCCQARSLEVAPSTTLQIRSFNILHLWNSCRCHLPRLHWALGQMGDALSRMVGLSRLES